MDPTLPPNPGVDREPLVRTARLRLQTDIRFLWDSSPESVTTGGR